MSLSIEAIGSERLADYASVPSVIEGKSMFVIDESDRGVRRFELHEQSIPVPYRKDYDSYGHGTPLDWSRRFDVSQWGFWLASDSGETDHTVAVAASSRRHGQPRWPERFGRAVGYSSPTDVSEARRSDRPVSGGGQVGDVRRLLTVGN